MKNTRPYDVGLSFSGKDRDFVVKVREHLIALGVKCFYDEDSEVSLVGQHLTERLPAIYREQCDLFVPFLSRNYFESHWARREKREALEVALKQDGFIIPIRLDDTDIPGIPSSLGYTSADKRDHSQIADIIARCLLGDRIPGGRQAVDSMRVSTFLQEPALPLTPGSEQIVCPLGQAHLERSCQVAIQRLQDAWCRNCYDKGWSEQEFLSKGVARKIVKEMGFEGPSYSLQLSFVDFQGQIVAHPEIQVQCRVDSTGLPGVVSGHILNVLSNGRFRNGVAMPRFYAWHDSIRSAKYSARFDQHGRSNLAIIYPDSLEYSGSGPQQCRVVVLGELHLK